MPTCNALILATVGNIAEGYLSFPEARWKITSTPMSIELIEQLDVQLSDLYQYTKLSFSNEKAPAFLLGLRMWRRDRDLKTIYTETYKNQSL